MKVYVHMIATVAAASLALAATTGAASPQSSHAPTHHVSGTSQLPVSGVPLTTPQAVNRALASAGIPQGPTQYVSGSTTSGKKFYGIIWLLYNSQSHGISDTASDSALLPRPAIDSAIITILENVGGGVITWGLVEVSKGVYKYVKKYLYKGKHLYLNAGDGECMANSGKGQDDTLRSCNDKHFIYWTYSTTGQLWDTYSHAWIVASNLDNGTKLFTANPAKDWHTWTYEDICSSAGC
jgi:hypothetical protein